MSGVLAGNLKWASQHHFLQTPLKKHNLSKQLQDFPHLLKECFLPNLVTVFNVHFLLFHPYVYHTFMEKDDISTET